MTELNAAGEPVEEIARLLERQEVTIRARLAKLRRARALYPEDTGDRDQTLGAR